MQELDLRGFHQGSVSGAASEITQIISPVSNVSHVPRMDRCLRVVQ